MHNTRVRDARLAAREPRVYACILPSLLSPTEVTNVVQSVPLQAEVYHLFSE